MKTIIFCIFFLVFPFQIFAGELEDRKEIYDKVKDLLYTGDYAGLEKVANEYRINETRTSSGLWKLTLYYAGFDEILPYQTNNPEKWSELLQKIDLWKSMHPKSPTPYIAKSIILKKQAWSIRGTGYSNTVAKEAWAPFYKKIDESRRVLEESQSVSKLDPNWYEVMSDIANIESWENDKFEKLINEGLGSNPYFYQLYFSAMYYYTPKWHGNAKQIEQFARAALKRTKENEGYGMYARIYWFASQSQFEGELFERSDVDWNLMSKGIDDVLIKYPDQWNINNFALFACMARDKNKTNKLINMINGEPIKRAWLNNLSIYDQCKNWTNAS